MYYNSDNCMGHSERSDLSAVRCCSNDEDYDDGNDIFVDYHIYHTFANVVVGLDKN